MGRAQARRCHGLGLVGLLTLLLTAGGRASMSTPAAVRATGRHVAVRALGTGAVLVASRMLNNGIFAQSVVVLMTYGRDGAAGLVVNHQTDVPLSGLFPWVDVRALRGATAFVGGPVEPAGARALLRSSSPRPDLAPVLSNVYLIDSRDGLDEELARRPIDERLRVYVGYAGWRAGQLEREVDAGAWHVVEGSADIVFDPQPETLWRRTIRMAEGVLADAAGGGSAAAS